MGGQLQASHVKGKNKALTQRAQRTAEGHRENLDTLTITIHEPRVTNHGYSGHCWIGGVVTDGRFLILLQHFDEVAQRVDQF